MKVNFKVIITVIFILTTNINLNAEVKTYNINTIVNNLEQETEKIINGELSAISDELLGSIYTNALIIPDQKLN